MPSDGGPHVDLHLHSNRSDGLLDPAAVMAAAEKAGLAAAALTDHDTLDGLAEAAGAADELGIEFVPGLELSARDDTGSTHLLGYFVDPSSTTLMDHLNAAREDRERRAERMVEKLNGLGLGVTVQAVRAESEGGLIARPHVARALVAGGWVKSYREAFDRYIAADGPAYVPTRRLEPAAGIELIHAAGGLAVLAHPGRDQDRDVIRDLAGAGLDGLETLHPNHGHEVVRELRGLARELGLLESGGSDWHGPREGGHGQIASQPVPYEWYRRMKDAAAARVAMVEEDPERE